MNIKMDRPVHTTRTLGGGSMNFSVPGGINVLCFMTIPYEEKMELNLQDSVFYLSEDHRVYMGDNISKLSSCAGYCVHWTIRKEWNGKAFTEFADIEVQFPSTEKHSRAEIATFDTELEEELLQEKIINKSW